MADSQSLRPGTPVKKGANKENRPQSSSSTGAGTNNQSEAKQDANMADSQTLRPGTGVEDSPGRSEGGEKDTDAMGASGSIIDLAKEKAKDAKKEAEEADPAAGAEHAGTEWTAPGSSDS